MPAATDTCALAIQTSALELKYERSVHLVDMITRDENTRKLRFDNQVLEDDNTELRELLVAEQDRADKLEAMMNAHLERAESAEAAMQDLEATTQAREQDISALQAERNALQNLTTDTSKLVTQKLELTHEMTRLKPELEHLRAQVASNEGLLTEKLTLQRTVSELEVQLENAKRDAQRAMAKRRNTMHEVAQEDELESLRKSLSKEKRLHDRAKETMAELESAIEELKKSAQREYTAENKSAEKTAEVEIRAQELARELAREQKDKLKAERALNAAQENFDSTKAILEDKLTQYKNRVRTLKDRLKETETNLGEAQAAASKAATKAAAVSKSVTIAESTAPAAKQTKARKRAAGTMDPDATTLGTPGDAPAKRARKGASVGEKSSFSITPFLNRTLNISGEVSEDETESPAPANNATADSSDVEEEKAVTPTAPPKQTKAKKQPLQPVPASKQNSKKAAPAAKAPKLALQVVQEEDEPVSPKKQQIPVQPEPTAEAAAAAAAAVPTQKKDALVPKPKVRKSLATFAAFTLEPEPERKKTKARRLGGLGKTLFDEEEDVGTMTGPSGPLGRKPSGGLFGKLSRGAGGGSFLLGGKRSDDGFSFSPLKRERKASGMSFLK